MLKGISFSDNSIELLHSDMDLLEKIVDKLDGEQISNIALNVLKYGTICFVAYVCGTEGVKSLSQFVS